MNYTGAPASMAKRTRQTASLPSEALVLEAEAVPAIPHPPQSPPISAMEEEQNNEDSAADYPQLQTLPPNATNVAKQLHAMPIVRPLILRNKRKLGRLDKGADNLEAALAQQRGTLRTQECNSCFNKSGPFANGCVTVEGKFNFSCANCRFNGEGGRCSFKPNSNNSRRGVRKNAVEKKTVVRRMSREERERRLIEILRERSKLDLEEAAIREMMSTDSKDGSPIPSPENGHSLLPLQNGKAEEDEDYDDEELLKSQLIIEY